MGFLRFLVQPLNRIYRGAVYNTLRGAVRLGLSPAWASRTLSQLTGQVTELTPAGRRWISVAELSRAGTVGRLLGRSQIISLLGAPLSLNAIPAKYEIVLRVVGLDGSRVERTVFRSVFTDNDTVTFGELLDEADRLNDTGEYDQMTNTTTDIWEIFRRGGNEEYGGFVQP